MVRLIQFTSSLLVGVTLVMAPWTALWENHPALSLSLTAREILLAPWFRGGVSGLGVVNLLAAAADLHALVFRRGAEQRVLRIAHSMLFPKGRRVLMAILGPDGVASARPALEGGADLIQLRVGKAPSRDLASLARAITAVIPGGDRVIVNGRPDLAELVGALGVHLKESGLSVASVRRHFPGLVVGVSRHDREGLERAAAEGADYAIFGPVFETPGKEPRALGLDRFREAIEGLALPVIGVGGITAGNTAAVIDAGAVGVAAIRPFEEAAVAAFRTADFRRVLDAASRNPA